MSKTDSSKPHEIVYSGARKSGLRNGVVYFIPIAFFLALVLPRLSWGLPSPQRLQYYPNDPSIMQESQTSRFYVTSPIESEHPDEGAILNALSNMHPDRFDFNPRFFNYPSLHVYTVGAALAILKRLRVVQIVNDKSFYFSHPEEMAKIYLVGRLITILYSISAIVLVGLITGLLTASRISAFVSSMTLAAMPLWDRDSLFLLVNVPAAALMTLSVYLSLKSYRRNDRWLGYLASVAAGLAAGAKYPSALVVIVPIMSAILIGKSSRNVRRIASIAATHLSIAFLAFLITTPFSVITPRVFLDNFLFEAHDKFSPKGLLTSWSSLLFAIGPLLILALLCVWIHLVRVRPRVAAVLALWFFIGAWGAIFSDKLLLRYWIPALPAIATTIGIGFSALQRTKHYGLFATLLIAAVVYTAAYSIDLNAVSARIDPRMQAADWIKNEVPRGSALAINRIYFDLPPVSDVSLNLIKLQEKSCNVPDNAWLVKSEALNGTIECGPARPVRAVFSNPLTLFPFRNISTMPADLYFTNLRIVVYGPRNEI